MFVLILPIYLVVWTPLNVSGVDNSFTHNPHPKSSARDKPGFTGDNDKCLTQGKKNVLKSKEPRCFSCSQSTCITYCCVSPHLFFSSSPLQACGDPKAKPSYLVDKNLESAVKFIVRKFPAVETRNNNVSTPACVSTVCLTSF